MRMNQTLIQIDHDDAILVLAWIAAVFSVAAYEQASDASRQAHAAHTRARDNQSILVDHRRTVEEREDDEENAEQDDETTDADDGGEDEA